MDATEFNIRIISLKDRLFRLARLMLGDSADAEDAVQEVYEKLWRKRNDLDRYDNIEAVVYTSTRNHCNDRIRSRSAIERRNEVVALQVETSVDGIRAVEISDKKELVMQLIGELPDKQQMVMHLRDIEEYETDRIAELTGLDETAVRVNLSRARKKVREQMIKIMNHGI